MPRIDELRREIAKVEDEELERYLVERSGLPEERLNLQLVHAAAEEAPVFKLTQWVRKGPAEAPNDAPPIALVMAGAVGLGRLIAEDEDRHVGTLRAMTSDQRWRVREAVAMALQRVGTEDPEALFEIAESWADTGGPFEQRAAVAGVVEPHLLEDPEAAERALDLVDDVTEAFHEARTHDDEGLVALREALGYAWSVVVPALPDLARPRFEAWLAVDDPNVRWVLKENLKTEQMHSVDPAWAKRTLERLDQQPTRGPEDRGR